ncbi:glycosyltransferase [Ekhidna sp.]|uniref:glycosyltransferase n=1 Tax=Ekhidna sp. TaxID=2608089 RepID=UPI003CCBC4AB
MKKDIICFTMTTWEGDYMKTIVHVMGSLASNHRVLFVDYPFTYKDAIFVSIGKSKAPLGRMLGVKPRLRTVSYKSNEVFHLTLPPILPTNWIKDPQEFDQKIKGETSKIARSVKKAMNRLGMKNPVVINAFNPIIGDSMVGAFNESLLLYYCYDEIAAAHWCKVHGGRKEASFMKKVDGIITTSEGLQQTKKEFNPNTFLVKNGVDFDLFEKAFDSEADINHPTVGYIGSVDDRLDYDLLEYVIGKHPEFEFHFVGRITYPEGQQRLKQFDNVQFFGSQQPDQLPQFLKTFDVGVIPFVKNEFTRNIYPLKINEYLAAGKPVVTTDFANLHDFEGIVSIASSTVDFSQMLQKELTSNTVERMEARMELAKTNSWNTRVKQVNDIIDTLSNPVHA